MEEGFLNLFTWLPEECFVTSLFYLKKDLKTKEEIVMMSKEVVQTSRVQWIAKVSVLAAIAFLLMMFEIPLPFAPSFYKLGLDEVAVLLAGFAMGPMAGAMVEVLKILLNLLFQGTDTAFVGEISNLIIGLAFVLPASYYYQKNKTQKNAYLGMVIGTVCMAIVGAISNYFIALPAYSYFYGLPMDTLIGMGRAILPFVTNRFTFVLFMTIPFNFIKGIVVSLVVGVLYKRVSPILHK